MFNLYKYRDAPYVIKMLWLIPIVSYKLNGDTMNDELLISNIKLANLAKQLAKTFCIDEEEAMSLVYEEWDLVEDLFHAYSTLETIHHHLIEEINYTYRIV